MSTWFNTPARLAALEAAADRWLHTPWRENSAVCGEGGGVSCHNLIAELYFETGCLPRFDVPRGRARALLNNPAPVILSFLDKDMSDRFVRVDAKPELALPGDTIVLRDSLTHIHMGVMVGGGQFVHVMRFSGVTRSMAADSTYGRNLEAIRRPLP